MIGRRLGGRWVAVATAAILFAGGCGGSERQPSAAEQVPELSVVLHRVDSALAAHRFGVAKQQLKNLKSDVVKARDAGDLRAADAARVLDAIARLLAVLPTSTSPSQTPDAETPSTSPPSKSPRPSPSRPEHPDSTVASPSTSPTPTPTPSTSESPSSSPSPTQEASPTNSATRDGSPTASPSPAP